MTLTRTLEKLERFGDSDADRALRPPVDGPAPHDGPDAPRAARSWRRPLLIGLAVVLATVVVVTYLVGFSPLLGASSVQVQGATTVPAAQIRTAAAIADGSPLVRLDTAAVARRVEQLPEIASARAAVVYPSTVVVTVVERTPVLLVANPTRLVDAGGRAYRTVPAGGKAPAGLPMTAATGPGLAVAATVAGDLPARARAVVLRIDVAPAPSAGLTPTVTLALVDGRTVKWGDTGRSAEKGQLLAALVAPATGAAPTVPGNTIDISDPGTVLSY